MAATQWAVTAPTRAPSSVAKVALHHCLQLMPHLLFQPYPSPQRLSQAKGAVLSFQPGEEGPGWWGWNVAACAGRSLDRANGTQLVGLGVSCSLERSPLQ